MFRLLGIESLLSYLTSLTFYLHLLSSGISLSTLRAHPIRQRLLFLRETTQELASLGLMESADDVSSDMETPFSDGLDYTSSSASSPRSRISDSMEEVKAMRRFAEPEATLVEPNFFSSGSSKTGQKSKLTSHFGEGTYLDRSDIEDKVSRKNSLRFYAARITTSQVRYAKAGRNRGGDDDISYSKQPSQTAEPKALNHMLFDIEGPKPSGSQGIDTSMDNAKSLTQYYDLVHVKNQRQKEGRKEAYNLTQEHFR